MNSPVIAYASGTCAHRELELPIYLHIHKFARKRWHLDAQQITQPCARAFIKLTLKLLLLRWTSSGDAHILLCGNAILIGGNEKIFFKNSWTFRLRNASELYVTGTESTNSFLPWYTPIPSHIPAQHALGGALQQQRERETYIPGLSSLSLSLSRYPYITQLRRNRVTARLWNMSLVKQW